MAAVQAYYDYIGFTSPGFDGETSRPPRADLSRTALILGFDGTLTDRPEAAAVPRVVRDRLRYLHRRVGGAMAIVSGRGLAELEAILAGYDGVLVGSHGAEWRMPGGEYGVAGVDAASIAGIKATLAALARQIPGVRYLDKPVSAALDFRDAPDRLADGCHILTALARTCAGIELRHGTFSLEMGPSTVSKRQAVERMLSLWPDRVPLAFGDDAGDEAVFGLIQARGGSGVKVGDAPTEAACRVASVSEVHATLEDWLALPETPCAT